MIAILCGIVVSMLVLGLGIVLFLYGLYRWLFGDRHGNPRN